MAPATCLTCVCPVCVKVAQLRVVKDDVILVVNLNIDSWTDYCSDCGHEGWNCCKCRNSYWKMQQNWRHQWCKYGVCHLQQLLTNSTIEDRLHRQRTTGLFVSGVCANRHQPEQCNTGSGREVGFRPVCEVCVLIPFGSELWDSLKWCFKIKRWSITVDAVVAAAAYCCYYCCYYYYYFCYPD